MDSPPSVPQPVSFDNMTSNRTINTQSVVNAAALCTAMYKEDSDRAVQYLAHCRTKISIQSFSMAGPGHNRIGIAFDQREQHRVVYICLRGTAELLDWVHNFDIRDDLSDYASGGAHTGFTNFAKKISPEFVESLLFEEFQVVLCGHSLGAAAVKLFLGHLLGLHRFTHFFTFGAICGIIFGAPSAGDAMFGKLNDYRGMKEHLLVINNQSDLIPQIGHVLKECASSGFTSDLALSATSAGVAAVTGIPVQERIVTALLNSLLPPQTKHSLIAFFKYAADRMGNQISQSAVYEEECGTIFGIGVSLDVVQTIKEHGRLATHICEHAMERYVADIVRLTQMSCAERLSIERAKLSDCICIKASVDVSGDFEHGLLSVSGSGRFAIDNLVVGTEVLDVVHEDIRVEVDKDIGCTTAQVDLNHVRVESGSICVRTKSTYYDDEEFWVKLSFWSSGAVQPKSSDPWSIIRGAVVVAAGDGELSGRLRAELCHKFPDLIDVLRNFRLIIDQQSTMDESVEVLHAFCEKVYEEWQNKMNCAVKAYGERAQVETQRDEILTRSSSLGSLLSAWVEGLLGSYCLFLDEADENILRQLLACAHGLETSASWIEIEHHTSQSNEKVQMCDDEHLLADVNRLLNDSGQSASRFLVNVSRFIWIPEEKENTNDGDDDLDSEEVLRRIRSLRDEFSPVLQLSKKLRDILSEYQIFGILGGKKCGKTTMCSLLRHVGARRQSEGMITCSHTIVPHAAAVGEALVFVDYPHDFSAGRLFRDVVRLCHFSIIVESFANSGVGDSFLELVKMCRDLRLPHVIIVNRTDDAIQQYLQQQLKALETRERENDDDGSDDNFSDTSSVEDEEKDGSNLEDFGVNSAEFQQNVILYVKERREAMEDALLNSIFTINVMFTALMPLPLSNFESLSQQRKAIERDYSIERPSKVLRRLENDFGLEKGMFVRRYRTSYAKLDRETQAAQDVQRFFSETVLGGRISRAELLSMLV